MGLDRAYFVTDAKIQDNYSTGLICVELYCVSDLGESVMINVNGFTPSFYLNVRSLTETQISEILEGIDYISTKRLSRRMLYGWKPNDIKSGDMSNKVYDVLELSFESKKKYIQAIETISETKNPNNPQKRIKYYEEYRTSIVFDLKFYDFTGGAQSSKWISLKHMIPTTNTYFRKTYKSLEYSAFASSIVVRDDLAEKVPHLRILSWDIECNSLDGGFPCATNSDDFVICIGVSHKVFGSDDGTIQRIVFCLKQTDQVSITTDSGERKQVETVCFNKETDLLLAFRDYIVKELDPDVIIGYNQSGFDWKYICDRATFLGINNRNDYERFGKKKGKLTRLQSDTKGQRPESKMDMDGRIEIDIYTYLKKDVAVKLRSLKLNDVSRHFLNDEKIDLPPKEIFACFAAGPDRRSHMAEYCAKDCDLPIKLLDKRLMLTNLIEMARVTCTPIKTLLAKGQQAKVFGQLFVYCHKHDILINEAKIKKEQGCNTDGYQGATVIEPKPMFYNKPIATLDFKSLYPSIMQGHNLCYFTYVFKDKYKNVPGVKYIHVPGKNNSTHTFIQNGAGIIPEILTNILNKRAETRETMKTTSDDYKHAVLDGRQLALKVSANSIYGFTGAGTFGYLPCVPIADSVTSIGRDMLFKSREYVEKAYPGSQVVYGDTDSVMVDFNLSSDGLTRDQWNIKSFELGEKAALELTDLFPDSVEMEMEKTYFPYLLYKKKNYAALMYLNPHKPPKVDMKGMQSVRRDSLLFTSELQVEILNILLYQCDVPKAMEHMHQRFVEFINGNVPYEKFIMSKSLKRNYKGKQIQLTVVERMRQRQPGSEPRVGDRVPYIILKSNGSTKTNVSDQADDPIWAKENKKELDLQYYFAKRVYNAIMVIIEPLLLNAQQVMDYYSGIVTQRHNKCQNIIDVMMNNERSMDVRKPTFIYNTRNITGYKRASSEKSDDIKTNCKKKKETNMKQGSLSAFLLN